MNTCMLAYTFYETDSRVRRYAESLAKRGDRVDVVALRREGQASNDVINGVRIYRIQKRIKNEKGKVAYLFRLLRFFIRSSIFVTLRHMRSRYDLIHVHSVPDFEVFATVVPKLTGAKIILDIHDIVPEFYADKFKVTSASFIFKALVGVERASCSFADHVIIANHIWEQRLTGRSVAKGKCTTMLNYPDTTLFRHAMRARADGKFVMLYPGTLNHHQGLDVAIRAFAMIADRTPGVELHIYGEGSGKEQLKELAASLKLGDRVFINNFLPTEKIAQVMADADVGVVPKRAKSFGNEAFSTKIFEFMALGVPVLIADTKIDRYYFDESLVKFFRSEDLQDLADNMLLMIRDSDLRKNLRDNAAKYISEITWTKKQQEYRSLVDRLVKDGSECRA